MDVTWMEIPRQAPREPGRRHGLPGLAPWTFCGVARRWSLLVQISGLGNRGVKPRQRFQGGTPAATNHQCLEPRSADSTAMPEADCARVDGLSPPAGDVFRVAHRKIFNRNGSFTQRVESHKKHSKW